MKVIEFNDWITPNAALANKDIDVNYFQHILPRRCQEGARL